MSSSILNSEIIAFANILADEAGVIACDYFRNTAKISIKGDGSPVTEADKAIETRVRALIKQHYPEHAILGEEFGVDTPDHAIQWVIDPIDGTKAFMAGMPLFTTLIALCHNNIPVLGIIDQPVLQERWVGMQGKQTLYNGTPFSTVHPTAKRNTLIATTSLPYFSESEQKAYDALCNTHSVQLSYGDAYAYAMLANGHIDVVIDAHLKPYDTAALIPIIEGAGGMVTDWQGNRVTLANSSHIIAAGNADLHAKTLQGLNV